MIMVLVVDDDADVRTMVRVVLERAGFHVHEAADGEECLRAVRRERPAAVLLDLSMPGMGGLRALQALREVSDVPVLVLTADADEASMVHVLGAGADAYVTKPFRNDELVARVKAMLRREGAPAPASHLRRLGSLQVDPERRQASVDGHPVHLTRIEFDVLDALMAAPNRAFARRDLVEKVWGPGWYGDEHLIDVHVSKLRRKLGDDPKHPRFIETVRGVGFRMAA